MRTLTEQYRSVKEGKGPKDVFLKEAKRQFPNLVTNASTFKEASTILKQKGIISENFVGMPMVGNPIERKKESYETAFANFLAEAEAKAEEKKVSKEVEEDAEKNYDYKDEKDPNNMIFGQIQMGYYYEMKQEKNADKTIDEIKDIVFKNLAKDPIYYTKNGQFGVDVGYTEDNVALGEPKEPKGKYKSSGYGNLKENKELKEDTSSFFKPKYANMRKNFNEYHKEKTKKTIGVDTDGLDMDDFIAALDSWLEQIPSQMNMYALPIRKNEDSKRAFIQAVMMGNQDQLKESKKPVNEIAIAGGLVTGGGFTSANYMDFFGLSEQEGTVTTKDPTEAEKLAKKGVNVNLTKEELEEDEAGTPAHIVAVADILATKAEEILSDASDRGEELDDEDVDKVLDMVLDISGVRDVLKAQLNLHIDNLNADR